MNCVRVLQIGLSSYPGGVENAMMNYYRFIDRDKVRFDFVCTEDTLAYSDEIEASGSNIFYLPSPKRNMIAYARELKKLIKIGQYDVVHVNMLSAVNIFPAVFAKQAGAKRIIAHAHNANLPGNLKKLLHHIFKFVIPYCTTDWFACSKEAAVWLFGTKGERKVRIVQNAIDHKSFQFNMETRRQQRLRYGIAEDAPVIGHVGRFGEEKNQKYLLERFAQVKEFRPEARLVLVGNGDLLETVKQQAKQLGIAQDVIFVGGVDNAAPYYQMMDVFCLPSVFEGLGIVAIEAQISGLPCICSAGVPAAAIITKNAVRIDLQDSDKWVKQIVDMLAYERRSMDEKDILHVGYNVADEAVKLQEYYTKGIAYEASQSVDS